jgi:hypothetical protein
LGGLERVIGLLVNLLIGLEGLEGLEGFRRV